MDDFHSPTDRGLAMVQRIIAAHITPADQELIGKIAQRAADLVFDRGQWKSDKNLMSDITMHCIDISAIHALTCPLKLWQWFASDNHDFMHDFRGIITHINRDTGELLDGFQPMFAVTPKVIQ